MCNHLKTRGWKQNVIQSRFDFSPLSAFQYVGPPCADPGKTWTIALRCSSHARVDTPHIPPWSLSLSPDSILLVQDVACTQHARSNHLQPPRSIGSVRHAPSCLPTHTTCLSPSLRVVEDRAQSARGPTSTFLPLWHLPCPVRQLVERPLRGFARFCKCPV